MIKSERFVWSFALIAVIAIFAISAFADQDYLPTGSSENLSRPCSFEGVTAQVVTVTGTTAATTNATGSGTVRIMCTQDTHFVQGASGASPTATANDHFIPGYGPEYFFSRGGKFAFIRDTTSGTCYVSDCK